jgi:phosphate transport system substrate-binding protein
LDQPRRQKLRSRHTKLDGSVLAGMYLRTITKWNDEAIVALNAGLNLPDKAITTVYR